MSLATILHDPEILGWLWHAVSLVGLFVGITGVLWIRERVKKGLDYA